MIEVPRPWIFPWLKGHFWFRGGDRGKGRLVIASDSLTKRAAISSSSSALPIKTLRQVSAGNGS